MNTTPVDSLNTLSELSNQDTPDEQDKMLIEHVSGFSPLKLQTLKQQYLEKQEELNNYFHEISLEFQTRETHLTKIESQLKEKLEQLKITENTYYQRESSLLQDINNLKLSITDLTQNCENYQNQFETEKNNLLTHVQNFNDFRKEKEFKEQLLKDDIKKHENMVHLSRGLYNEISAEKNQIEIELEKKKRRIK